MRTVSILVLLLAFCLAGASFKDPRKLHPVAPLTQQEMEKLQGLQKTQGIVGGVPEKTDGSGYAPQPDVDPEAAAILANHADTHDKGGEATASALKAGEENLQAAQHRSAHAVSGALWALLAGMILAVGAWAGLQKFGPKPPAHLAR